MKWTVAECWSVATEVVALAYNVPIEGLRAPSRGRGPKPPKAVQFPKKVAIHLTILASGCDYAALARHIGLHRDTVASHAAEMREGQDAADAEALSIALHAAVDARLLLIRSGKAHQRQLTAARIRANLETLNRALAALADILAEAGISSDAFIRPVQPTTKEISSETVIRHRQPTIMRRPVASPTEEIVA